ncbi:MAG: DUF1461 domain-containing protein [Nanoarchaeota archaeon]|nr:DUF1461 domain-containing protein [Nanoarchaeota archaeon]
MGKAWPVVFLMVIVIAPMILLVSADYWIFREDHYAKHFENGIYDDFNEDFPDDTKEEIDSIAYELLGYMGDKDHSVLAVPEGFFSPDELSHMEDVRTLVLKGKYFLHGLLILLIILTALLAAVSYLVIPKLWVSYFFKYLGASLTYAPMILLLLSTAFFVALENFSSVFVSFHNVFFPQGNWQFPEDASLVRLFPEEFFKSTGENIVITAAVVSLVIMGLGIMMSRFGPQWNLGKKVKVLKQKI